ncbi:hypothetical protein H7J55_16230, partial [Mycolicibacterium brisbanense]|nr:hypothetical protein [Mycolicibacterium brisbanense]
MEAVEAAWDNSMKCHVRPWDGSRPHTAGVQPDKSKTMYEEQRCLTAGVTTNVEMDDELEVSTAVRSPRRQGLIWQSTDLGSFYNAPVSGYTHVVEYNGGTSIAEIGHADVRRFARPLHAFNCSDRFALTLWALPDGMDYEKARATGHDALAYLQAGGSADTLTLDIRKDGGSEWGADWVRYVVGHPPAEERPRLVVPIPLPRGAEMVAQNELFGADEAADLFYSYFK